ncbi:MAG: hypothetical protein KVP17_001064 [Porospora cf. gigantea B]|uniref:uncharacterized protein n=1 Tax=Porospora cf. gigantea B TaxID=2853592 RepID=UPI003571E06B|nr:MAG: hypothetical protein KVP17_001064 [Porospora cf. gigantea B]
MWEEANHNVRVLFSLYEKLLVEYDQDIQELVQDQTYLETVTRAEPASEADAADLAFAAQGLDFRLDEIQRSLRRLQHTEAAIEYWIHKSEISFEADLYKIQEFAENRVEEKLRHMEEQLA